MLILPGYIVLCGSLELANRSIISGSVRLVCTFPSSLHPSRLLKADGRPSLPSRTDSILYSLFLGFGLAMGSEVYQRVTGLEIAGATDFTCSALRIDAPWYRATIPPWFYFLTIPWFLLMLALRNGQPFFRKETIVMLIIGSAGESTNERTARAHAQDRWKLTFDAVLQGSRAITSLERPSLVDLISYLLSGPSSSVRCAAYATSWTVADFATPLARTQASLETRTARSHVDLPSSSWCLVSSFNFHLGSPTVDCCSSQPTTATTTATRRRPLTLLGSPPQRVWSRSPSDSPWDSSSLLPSSTCLLEEDVVAEPTWPPSRWNRPRFRSRSHTPLIDSRLALVSTHPPATSGLDSIHITVPYTHIPQTLAPF